MGAVINLTKVIGKDYATTGKDITCNCVAPAVVQTAMVDAMPAEQVKYMTDKIPMARTSKLDEVASTVPCDGTAAQIMCVAGCASSIWCLEAPFRFYFPDFGFCFDASG